MPTGIYIRTKENSLNSFHLGMLGKKHSKESKDKIKKAIQKKYDDGFSNWNKGLPKEQQPMFGKKHTEETCKKIIESVRKADYHHTDEFKKKTKERMKGNKQALGYKWTPEQIQKRNEAIRNGKGFKGNRTKGRIVSEATREKLRIKSTGRIKSQESIDKGRVTYLKNHPDFVKKVKEPKIPLPNINCSQCNIPFTPKSKVNKFCSKKCYKIKNRYTKKDSKDWSPRVSRKGIPRPEVRGEKHGNWQGGITKERDKAKNSPEYKQWQIDLFKRDNWTCQKCGKRHDIVGHHILNFSVNKDLRYSLDNGITLCPDCHNLFHKIYTVYNNTREQLEEFLISTETTPLPLESRVS